MLQNIKRQKKNVFWVFFANTKMFSKSSKSKKCKMQTDRRIKYKKGWPRRARPQPALVCCLLCLHFPCFGFVCSCCRPGDKGPDDTSKYSKIIRPVRMISWHIIRDLIRFFFLRGGGVRDSVHRFFIRLPYFFYSSLKNFFSKFFTTEVQQTLKFINFSFCCI